MFEKATRMKLRFPSPRGGMTVEDLWDVPLRSKDNFNLDEIAKICHYDVEKLAEKSFVEPAKKGSAVADLKFEIVKHVIKVKLQEENERLLAKETKEKEQKLLSLIAEKKESILKEKSIEELQAELEELKRRTN